MAEQEDVIKVSGSSNPSSVGSILARAIVAGQTPKMRAISRCPYPRPNVNAETTPI